MFTHRRILLKPHWSLKKKQPHEREQLTDFSFSSTIFPTLVFYHSPHGLFQRSVSHKKRPRWASASVHETTGMA